MGGAVTALRIGVVGAGQISGAYLSTLRRLSNVEVVAVCDLDEARARTAAAAAPGARPLAIAELLAADDVDLVLNLTIPAAHAEVARAAIAAGKHVYGEKPLAVTTGQAREVLAAAGRAGVRVGCAPDTVLGTGVQTARACLDAGEIGTPIAATAFMVTPGHERWHPAPEFYYLPGGGPLFDMGPYYLTALVTLLGPVRRGRHGGHATGDPHHRQRSPCRRRDRRGGGHARDRRPGARQRGALDADDELRRVGRAAAVHRGLRHRRVAIGARSQRVRRTGADLHRRG
jgi:predicted dehydrogenase